MLSQLPLEILIKIINHLSFYDVLNLLKLKNYHVYSACRSLLNIKLTIKDRKSNLYKYLNAFDNPKILDVRDGNTDKNKLLKIINNREWSLERIVLNNTRTVFDQTWCQFFKKQQKIKEITLYAPCELEGKHINQINRNLEVLKIRYHYLSFGDLLVLNDFPYLKDLDLSYGIRLYNKNLTKLKLTNLEKINMTNTAVIFNEELYHFFREMKNLKNLHLDFNPFSFRTIENVNDIFPNLEVFTYSNSITSFETLNLKNYWYQLKHINFSYGMFDDRMFIDVINKAPNLEIINLDLTNITDLSVVHAVIKLKKLTKLNIARNKITNISGINIAYHCRNLKELDISATKINTRVMKKIIENNKIDILTIMDCYNIKKRFLKDIKILIT